MIGNEVIAMTERLDVIWNEKKQRVDEPALVRKNIQRILNEWKTLKRVQLQSGKTEDYPEIAFLNKKIQEFEKDLRTLQTNS